MTDVARLEVQRPTSRSHYKVAALEPLSTGGAKITVLAGDWLDMGTYAATYSRGAQVIAGSYAVYGCDSTGEPLTFVGIFRREREAGQV